MTRRLLMMGDMSSPEGQEGMERLGAIYRMIITARAELAARAALRASVFQMLAVEIIASYAEHEKPMFEPAETPAALREWIVSWLKAHFDRIYEHAKHIGTTQGMNEAASDAIVLWIEDQIRSTFVPSIPWDKL